MQMAAVRTQLMHYSRRLEYFFFLRLSKNQNSMEKEEIVLSDLICGNASKELIQRKTFQSHSTVLNLSILGLGLLQDFRKDHLTTCVLSAAGSQNFSF